MIIKLTQAHIIGAFISYLLGVFIVPFVIDFCQKEGLVDVPNERKIHKEPRKSNAFKSIFGGYRRYRRIRNNG